PPADALLKSFAGRRDILPLALHVDYWDYIGWKDTFGDPAHAERQRAYARHAGARMVYTPQIIVGGMEHIVGVKPGVLEKAIRMEAAAPDLVSLSLRPAGDKVEISARALGPIPDGTIVQLVRVRPSQTVDIGRGENAGRTFTYSHIVTDWTRIGLWNGEAPFTRKISAPGKDETVVIVQEPGPGRILAAAVLR
ncbi:MAG: DUF1223 domain-containing protein, partial [Rhodobacteraceae bacterium]|nr:DUF1223 domain-containing protein [Paracoccaceae bacterium]